MNWKRFAVKSRFFPSRWFYPLISVIVALGICLNTPLPSRAFDWLPILQQGFQAIQLSNISDRQEVELGKQINQQLVSSNIKLYRDPEVNRYVQQVGQRLVADSDRPNLPYTFQVVQDNSINAFATMGGYVYVHTGLLKAADNEAQLASVLGHEMGHIGGRHAIKQMQQTAIENGLLTASGLNRSQVLQLGVQVARNLPRSRKNEFEADQRGLRTLGRAGYAQSEMVSFMKKLLKLPAAGPAFLSNHPATGDRVAELQREINHQPTNGSQGLNDGAYKTNIQALLNS